MDWTSFFGGMVVAVLAISLGVGLWVLGGKKTLAIQSWGAFLFGAVCVFIAIYLGLQLWNVGGFLAWCWKLPTIICASVFAFYAIDVGLHGDQPPR